jgi:hypothetical protein
VTGEFDPDLLLALLPRRVIRSLPPATQLPRKKSVGNLSDYNGFTGKERLRTFEIEKWLIGLGAVTPSHECDICHRPASGRHAEDYFDLSSWMGLCHSCHSRLHKRFGNTRAWRERIEEADLPDDHWARAISREPFDLARLLRQREKCEPVHADFLP